MIARPKPCRPVFCTGFSCGSRCREFLEQFPGPVGTAVIDHDDFVGYILQAQFQVEVLDRGADAAFLIPGRDDDGKELQLVLMFGSEFHGSPDSSSQSRMLLGMGGNFLEDVIDRGFAAANPTALPPRSRP